MLKACPKFGMDVAYAHPVGYEPFEEVIKIANETAASNNTAMEGTNDPVAAVTNADIIVTDTWISMGEEDQKAEKIKIFDGYRVFDIFLPHKRLMFVDFASIRIVLFFVICCFVLLAKSRQVSTEFCKHAKPDFKFMHCLPRKPEEVRPQPLPSSRL